MAYEARRDAGYDPDDRDAQRERANQNNANNIRNAADVAIATKNPYAVAAGAAVKAADKITGGKSTEALGKGMTRANEMTPGGKRIQDLRRDLRWNVEGPWYLEHPFRIHGNRYHRQSSLKRQL